MAAEPKPIKSHKNLIAAAVALFWIIIWQLVSMAVGNRLLLVSPIETAVRFCELASNHEFWLNITMSLMRVAAGFLIGTATGIIAAVFSFRYKWIETLLSPLLTVIRATPVASFIVLALVWIGGERVPIFITFLMVLPVMWGSLLTALKNVDRELSEVADVFGANQIQKIVYLYMPTVKGQFRDGAVTASGLAWKAGIAAEVICVPMYAIGKRIYEAKLYIETVDLFAWTAALIILSMLIERAIKFALDKISE